MSVFGRDDKSGTASHKNEEPAPPRSPMPQTAKSVISEGLTITGNLESAGEIEVGGEISGDVHAQRVTILEGASVKGTIKADDVTLSGSLDGAIQSRHVAISATGHMTGDVVHEKLEIELGAHIDGTFRPTYGKSETNVTPLATKPLNQSSPKATEASDAANPGKDRSV